MSNRKAHTSTQSPNGRFWGCWVVTNIDTMRVAVFTSHDGLQSATIDCARKGHLYHVEIIIFEGELPSPSNIKHATEQVKNSYLTEDKLAYFNWLKGVRDGRKFEQTARNPTMTLAERLEQTHTANKRERYDED